MRREKISKLARRRVVLPDGSIFDTDGERAWIAARLVYGDAEVKALANEYHVGYGTIRDIYRQYTSGLRQRRQIGIRKQRVSRIDWSDVDWRMSDRQIAAVVGCTRANVFATRRKLHAPAPFAAKVPAHIIDALGHDPKTRARHVRNILRRLRRNATVHEVASDRGLSDGYIHKLYAAHIPQAERGARRRRKIAEAMRRLVPPLPLLSPQELWARAAEVRREAMAALAGGPE